MYIMFILEGLNNSIVLNGDKQTKKNHNECNLSESRFRINRANSSKQRNNLNHAFHR